MIMARVTAARGLPRPQYPKQQKSLVKVTAVETIVLQLPLRLDGPPPMVSGQPRTAIEVLLVRVDTDAGITGWGEGFGHRVWPATRVAIDRMIAPLVVGRDATQVAPLMADLCRSLHGAGRSGPVMYGLSAIDIALWDIAGKRAGQPLHRLLGGGPRADLPAYASLLRYGRADEVERRIAEALDRGYRHIKIHEIDPAIIRAARRAAGDAIPLMVDCNCPWTVDEAIAVCRSLQDCNLTWIEEPVWPPEDHDGLARVRAEGGIPIAAGENVATPVEFGRLFQAGALSYAQPSATKTGGVSALHEVFALGAAAGVPVVPHSAYFGPGLLASIQVCAATGRDIWVERFYCDFDELRSARRSIRSMAASACRRGRGWGSIPTRRFSSGSPGGADPGRGPAQMTIYDLKPAFQSLLRPLVRSLADAGVTANLVTRLAAVLSVALGTALAIDPGERVAVGDPPGIPVRAHGAERRRRHARARVRPEIRARRDHQRGRRRGVGCRTVPAVRLLPGAAPWLVVVAVLLAWLTEFAGVLAQTVGASRRYDGPLGKSDRAFVFGVLALLVALGVPLAAHWNAIFGVIVFLLVLTVWNRVSRALEEARRA